MKQLKICVKVVSNSKLEYNSKLQVNKIQKAVLAPDYPAIIIRYRRLLSPSLSEPDCAHETNKEMYRGCE